VQQLDAIKAAMVYFSFKKTGDAAYWLFSQKAFFAAFDRFNNKYQQVFTVRPEDVNLSSVGQTTHFFANIRNDLSRTKVREKEIVTVKPGAVSQNIN
jgi:hypothetical protein